VRPGDPALDDAQAKVDAEAMLKKLTMQDFATIYPRTPPYTSRK
jgi:ABC-type arginine transport system ATPase subunit